MTEESILLKKEGHIATITLNRPEKLNALDWPAQRLFGQILDDVAEDKEMRVLIITGAGRAFCAGGDVSAQKGRIGMKMAEKREGGKMLSKNPLKIRKMPKPVIGMVNGVAVGAGCNLALACDIIIASEKARFGQAFVKVGLAQDYGGSYLLSRLVGTKKACELVFTGDIIDAQEAMRIGLVNKVVPEGELEAATKEMAAKIASRAPLAVEIAKRSIYDAFDRFDLEMALEYENYVQGFLGLTDDHKEGATAFLEKREPQFKGM
ncbi:MAG: enoyl-CoA hydratase [Thermodesulfobacteriota bacterium]|nr:enoyl-CoA hydratase [Thermodesulfobacteriota bacterium]